MLLLLLLLLLILLVRVVFLSKHRFEIKVDFYENISQLNNWLLYPCICFYHCMCKQCHEEKNFLKVRKGIYIRFPISQKYAFGEIITRLKNVDI